MEPSAPGPAHELKSVDPANEEATEAWNGVLFDRFVAFREIVTTGLGAHGERALATYPPRPGDRVLDLGCGFGDTAQRLADTIGPEGSVVGIDVSERFIEAARDEAQKYIAEGRAAGEKMRADMIEATRTEQAEMLERARREIDAEKSRAIADLRREAVDLAIAGASRVIEKNLDDASNRKVVESFLASLPTSQTAR